VGGAGRDELVAIIEGRGELGSGTVHAGWTRPMGGWPSVARGLGKAVGGRIWVCLVGEPLGRGWPTGASTVCAVGGVSWTLACRLFGGVRFAAFPRGWVLSFTPRLCWAWPLIRLDA